jgi:hypothetical protein
MEDVEDEESGEDDENDDDEGNRDLCLRFLFDRPETTEEGWVALTTTSCLTCRDKGETDLVAGASSLEGVEWLEAGKMKQPPGAALVRVAAIDRDYTMQGG